MLATYAGQGAAHLLLLLLQHASQQRQDGCAGAEVGIDVRRWRRRPLSRCRPAAARRCSGWRVARDAAATVGTRAGQLRHRNGLQ